MNHDEDNIIDCIKKLNNTIGMWDNYTKAIKIGKFSKKMFDKVRVNGFYIGLYSNFKWIEELKLN